MAASGRRAFMAINAAALLAPAWVRAQQAFPAKPVELVVAFQPGGGVDAMARVFAEIARDKFPQPFVVVNKPGASGSIGLSYVAGAAPDGYRVAMVFAELLTIPLLGIGKVGPENFVPIAKFASDPSTLAVRSDAPWNTLEQFIDYARANPGKLALSNAGNGSISHISAAALGLKTGTRFVHAPYQGSAPAVLGLLGGQVEATAVNYSVLSSHITAGKLKPLAVMAERRYAALGEMPTLKERGIDLSVDVWRGIAVARGTPPEIVDAFQRLAEEVSRDPRLAEALRRQNLSLDFENGAAFGKAMAEESERFRVLIPQLELKA